MSRQSMPIRTARTRRWSAAASRVLRCAAQVALLHCCVASANAAAPSCAGDCNADSTVTVDEILESVRIALGADPASACASADGNGDGLVTVDDVLAAVNRALAGCQTQSVAFVIATDFETGSFGTISLDTPRVVVPASPSRRVYSDAVARTYGGLVYAINRFFGDNIQVLDPARAFATRLQCLTGERTNPHDIAFVNSRKAYVTLYERSTLLVVNPSAAPNCADFVLGSIDLAAFADADGIPEMDQMAIVGDRLYVSLQRLDRNNFFQPATVGSIVVIDTARDQITGDIPLTGTNPFGDTKGLTVRDGALVIAEAGVFGRNDGGIERIDLASGTARGFFVTEADLGGDITDFVLVSDDLGYAVVSYADFTNAVVAFDPRTRLVTQTLLGGNRYVSDLELDDRGELFVADRNPRRPGIRIFRASDGTELTAAPIDLGLPPFDILFLDR